MGCGDFSSRQIGLAFALTIAAGLATLGGTLVLWLANLRSNRFIAAALAFSSGVLLFVSLVDIYAGKSVGHFESAGSSSAQAFLLATVCFFSGMPLAFSLDLVSAYFAPTMITHTESVLVDARVLPDPDGPPHHDTVPHPSSPCPAQSASPAPHAPDPPALHATTRNSSSPAPLSLEPSEEPSKHHRGRLLKVGIMAALVIAFHNLPEGLVTFLAYLDSVQSGAAIAIAIAIHNIPEGIVVALPVYYATHSRVFAVLLSASSALTEPLGGLIGLAVACTGSMNDVAFGVIFGLVAGIMVQISLKELYPMARTLDQNDRVTTLSLIAGMVVMAASLVAIGYSVPPEDTTVAE